MAAKKAVKFQTLADGEWSDLPDREMCCHCGLVHDIAYRTKDGRIQANFTQNARATANARRRKGLIAKVKR